MRLKFYIFLIIVFCFSCKKGGEKTAPGNAPRIVKVPTFNEDSAYNFIAKQVAYGPRIPNTKAHRQAEEYLTAAFKKYGARVVVQEFESPAFDGQVLQLKNIIASYFPNKQKRILLAAHWDTRPFADKDKINPNAKFDGANDGGSGVAILLEIARQLSGNMTPDIGVDIILFDGEDWGERHGASTTTPLPDGLKDWWCLGSQYWSLHKHKPDYSAFSGILLDMAGARNAQFHREGHSIQFAPQITEKVWNTAERLGYSHFFVKQNQEGITDDHLFVNSLAKIPMTNIVHYDPAIGFFGDFHHSTKDNLDIIDKKTLKAVGETVLNVIYVEE